MKIEGQTFAQITEVQSTFADKSFDGIFGMGWDQLSVGGAPTPFTMMIQQHKVHKKQFAFWMNRYVPGFGKIKH